MNLTVAMPYTASGWQVDNKAITQSHCRNHHFLDINIVQVQQHGQGRQVR